MRADDAPGWLARFSLCSAALLCAVPFLQPYHRNPLTAFYSEWLALVLGLGVMAVLFDRRVWLPATLPLTAVAPVLLAMCVFTHGLLGWSPYFGQALAAALYLLWAAMLILAAHALLRLCGRGALLAVLSGGLAAGALAGALVGVIQFTGIATPLNVVIAQPVHASVFGNLAQANHFAAHTTLGLLALAYWHARGRLPWAVLAALALPLLFVLGVSGSRSPALYLAAALAGAWLVFRRSQQAELLRLAKVLFFFVLMYLVIQLAVASGHLRPPGRTAVTGVERLLFGGAAGFTDRLALWQAAWQMFLAQPLLGAGWGAFPGAHFQLAAQIYPPGLFPFFHNAHNLVLHVLAETGLAGLLLLAVPLVFARQRVPANAGTAGRWLLTALGAVIVLHSLLEYPLWYAYFLGPAALLLGAAQGRVLPLPVRRARPLVLAVLAVAVFNLAVVWNDYRDFESLFVQKPEHIDHGRLPALMTRLHGNPLLQPYVEVATALPMRLDENQLRSQLFLNSRAQRFVPQDILVYRQVLLLALAGRTAEARALLDMARHAYPSPPAEFLRDLRRLAAAQPALIGPLLESASLRVPARPE